MAKSTKQAIRNKADKLLQEYVRLLYKGILCYGCGEREMTVGHHFVSKKNSMALRFSISNIIPLCQQCHFLVHNQPHLVEPKICFLMGKEWYDELMQEKRQTVKFNLRWITGIYEGLEGMVETLE